MLTSTLRALNSNADRILTPTDWDITALETMRTNFEAACTGLDAVRIADYLVQNGKMKAVTCAEFAKEFDVDEIRAQTIIAYITIMLKTTPDLFRM